MKIPDFSLPTTGGGHVSLTSLAGKKFVLYFYPKADTPGCTLEACGFQESLPNFAKLGVPVIGVSKDPMPALEKFAAKYGLKFPLASAADSDLCEKLDVWKEKMNYGKTYWGIERSTFLVGPDGEVLREWRKVKVDGHVEEVAAAVKG